MLELNIPEPAAPAATPEPTPGASSPAPAADNPNPGTGAPASATAAAPSTPSPSAPANPAPAAEQKFEIKVDGKVESLSLDEIIARAQKGTKFTQNSQQLADERRRWDTDRQTILQKEKEAWLRELKDQETRARLEAEKDPAARAMDRVQTLEQKLEDQQLDSVLRPLLEKYQVDEQQFLIEASRNGLKSAADVVAHGEAIAKALADSQNSRFETRFKEVLSKREHPEVKALIEKAVAEYLQKKTAGPSPAPAGAITPSLGAPTRRAKTLDEAADIAEELLTGVAPSYQ